MTKTIEAALHAAKEIEANAHTEAARLERALRLARGTGDVTAQAHAARVNGAAKAPVKPRTLAEQIESVLRAHGILSGPALAHTLGVSASKLADELRSLKLRSKVYNIGINFKPRPAHAADA